MDIQKVLKALSDDNRMKIITLLSTHKYCVRALSHRLNISEPAVSQHIRILKNAGLIEMGDKKGYNVHYAVNKEIIGELALYLKNMAESVQTDRSCSGICKEEK